MKVHERESTGIKEHRVQEAEKGESSEEAQAAAGERSKHLIGQQDLKLKDG